jgi:hypothetical protein
MAAGHELIPELVIDLVVPPMLTGLWMLFVGVNNRIVDHNGSGSKIDAYPWRVLIQLYVVVFVLALAHLYSK